MPALSRRGALAFGAGVLALRRAHADTPADRPDAASLQQVTVLPVGDSLAQGLYLTLVPVLRRFQNVRLINGTQHATGLTRTDEHNWPTISRELVQRHRPDLVIYWIGANDFRPLVDRESRARHEFGGTAFRAAYGRRVAAMVAAAAEIRARPVWIGLPNMRNTPVASMAQRLNDIQREAAEAAGADWVSIWEATSDSEGRFLSNVTVDNLPRSLRAEDGVHFTDIGYRRVAALALGSACSRHPELAPVLGRFGTAV
jgi:uncharacterized protein